MYTAVTRGVSPESCAMRVPPGCVESKNGEAYVRNVVDRCLLLRKKHGPCREDSEACSGDGTGQGCGCTNSWAARHSNGGPTPHKCFADVKQARKCDFVRIENCMCCDGCDGTLLHCYSCENAVHERCVKNARLASSSWADPVCMREHYSGSTGQGDHVEKHFVCPQCYNDYHDMARVSKFCDAGYLKRQGVVSLW